MISPTVSFDESAKQLAVSGRELASALTFVTSPSGSRGPNTDGRQCTQAPVLGTRVLWQRRRSSCHPRVLRWATDTAATMPGDVERNLPTLPEQ